MKRCLFIMLVMLASLTMTLSARAEYKLGAGDELRLIVANKPDISGSYTVSDDGAVFVVMGGKVPVGGLTIDEAAKAISAKLAKYVVDPAIALEVSKYRPFYIMGDVANPGTYPAAPGLTALKSVAVAGGLRGRSNDLDAAVTGIRANESYFVALKQLLDARVQKARLQAELDGAASFDWKEEGIADSQRALLDKTVSYEKQLFSINSENYKKQVDLLENQITLRSAEFDKLKKRLDVQAHQTELLRTEITRTEGLLKNGISTISQRNALSREEDRLISEGLQIQLLQNQAQQGLNQAELQLANLRRDRKAQLLTQMADVTQKLQRLGEEIRSAEALMLETGAQSALGRNIATTRFLLRGNNGEAAEVPVEATYAVQPGDIITIRREIDFDKPANGE